MASPGQKSTPIEDQVSQPNRSTVMIMGRVGRVRSFKISPRIVFWAAVFFALYIAVSILIIHRYFDLRKKSAAMGERLNRFEQALPKSEKELLKSRQHIALLEDYIKDLEKRDEEESAPRTAEKARETPRKETPKKVEPLPAKQPEEKEQQPEPATLKLVAVEDMVVQKEGARMTVGFKLVNAQQGETAMGGYIHIIATRQKDDLLKAWSYPQQELEEGMPKNFRRGQLFLIQRFKPIQGKFNLGSSSETPTSIKVLAYNHTGDLIMKREYEVNNAP